MYIPQSFKIEDPAQVKEVINHNSFATLVTSGANGLQASHLPFEYNAEAGKLASHLARANPQWRDFASAEVMVIFQGEHGYISPQWYESELAVPTWNYVAVHVYGTVRILDDDAEAAKLLERLVANHESRMPAPWQLNAPEEWQANLRRAIVAFEVQISRIEAKAKLSQNRVAADITGAVAGLRSMQQHDLAAQMEHLNWKKLQETRNES